MVAGWGLVGTYMFYAVTTTIAAGIFGTSLLQTLKIWTTPPTWAPFIPVSYTHLDVYKRQTPGRPATTRPRVRQPCWSIFT